MRDLRRQRSTWWAFFLLSVTARPMLIGAGLFVWRPREWTPGFTHAVLLRAGGVAAVVVVSFLFLLLFLFSMARPKLAACYFIGNEEESEVDCCENSKTFFF